MQPSLCRALVLTLALAGEGRGNNHLWIVLDDLGVDRVGAYGEHPDPGSTPHIDRLAQRGILFRNAWSNPSCSPTRATLLTGRYSFRTGIGKPIPAITIAGAFSGLRLSETILPEVLGPGVWSAALGKWHLASDADGRLHPNASGFRTYAGAFRNLFGDGSAGIGTEPFDYFRWEKTVDGITAVTETYATTDTVDDAIAALSGLPEPWFLYVAFNASHKPLHDPPAHLHSFDLSGQPSATPVEHVKAMTEALDTEVGRLLAQVDLTDTTVVLLGDNGTWRFATDAPFVPEHGKGTLYEGGINVPLILAGADVRAAGRECAGLVNTTDLFATVCELAGKPADVATDSVSLVPYLTDPERRSLRAHVYAERFSPNGPGPWDEHVQALRDERHKLIWDRTTGRGELYDLLLDPFERDDLRRRRMTAAHLAVYARLRTALVALAGS